MLYTLTLCIPTLYSRFEFSSAICYVHSNSIGTVTDNNMLHTHQQKIYLSYIIDEEKVQIMKEIGKGTLSK